MLRYPSFDTLSHDTEKAHHLTTQPETVSEGVEFNIADIFDNAKSRIHSKTDLKMIRKGWSRKFMLLVLCFVCSREV
jgi:isopentenyl diphosphate isomerase/L-lactate dehydrogenase-like FMN-dependent dehydrogenase